MKRIALPISTSKTQLFINQSYVEYLANAGYEPDLIAPIATTTTSLDKICLNKAESCDGLLLPGGVDVDPIFYMENNLTSYKTDPEKDDFERMLLWAFAEAHKPIFGICRGFQLMAREYLRLNNRGNLTNRKDTYMSFWQNVSGHSDAARLEVERSQPTSFAYADTRLLYLPESGLQEERHIPINSMHHQAFTMIGPKLENPTKVTIGDHGLKVAVWEEHESLKPKGVIIEAMDFGRFFKGAKAIGVQWHPEELEDFDLLHNIFNSEGTDENQVQAANGEQDASRK